MTARRSVAAAVVIFLVGFVAGPAPGGAAGELTWRTYRPPTAGDVVDPFRPPPEPWLPGNRGIEYATEPGSTLAAIGPGVVAFAGPVAGRLVVSIVHPDGLRSALTGVAEILASEGQRLWAGAPVAVAGARVHLGVRRGDAYLDPESLWGSEAGGGRVQLVPAGRDRPRSPLRPPPVARTIDLRRRLLDALRW